MPRRPPYNYADMGIPIGSELKCQATGEVAMSAVIGDWSAQITKRVSVGTRMRLAAASMVKRRVRFA